MALLVQAGDVLRIVDIEGGQTCDLNAFVLPSFSERFSAGRTRTMSGVHPTSGDDLWSAPPHDRRLFSIVRDTVGQNDVLFPRCSSLRYEEVGLYGHPNCQDILAGAIAPFDLTPDDVHDSFNIFMNTSLDDSGRPVVLTPRALPGGLMELQSLVGALVALSACPNNVKYGRSNLPLAVEVLRSVEREAS